MKDLIPQKNDQGVIRYYQTPTSWIEASGENAKWITMGVVFSLVCGGISLLRRR